MNKHVSFEELRIQAGLTVEQLSEIADVTPRTVLRWQAGPSKPRKFVLDILESRIKKPADVATENFTFIDLFAGIGGLRRGFESIGGKCIFTSEWDKYAAQTYAANFPHDTHEVSGDITQIDVKDIPKHDVLLAGFPCQPFSIAGVSKKNSLNRPHGFKCETQGTLFFDVKRVIEHHRPRAFLLENVKNLVNHDKGNTFATIKKILTEELGYSISFRVINSAAFVPQKRERIIIVGFREKCDFSLNTCNFPEPDNGPRMGAILHPEDGTEAPDQRFTLGNFGTVSEKYELSDLLWSYLQGYAAKHKKKGNGFGFGLVNSESVSRTMSARYYKDGSEILVEQKGKNPRRLTPRECARLMGFDGPNESNCKIPVSDTQAYKQFGNSVVVPVIEAVAKEMKPYIY
jgi:DNA (cytosine-5)-methyltransferase 1